MSKPNRCEYPFKACDAVQERDALRAALAGAEENECARWQGRFEFLHREFDVDGSFCDSGDPLDFTESEVRQVIVKLTDRATAAEAKLAEPCETVCDECLRARRELEAKLADAEKHADELAKALDDIRCSCTRVTISGVWATLKCARCHALAAHTARRAGKEETK